MRSSTVFFSYLLSAILASPSPKSKRGTSASYVALPFTRELTASVAGKDKRQVFTSALSRLNVASYFINVTIGTPPQPLSLVLDTGSSDIWAYAPAAEDSCPGCTVQFYDPTQSSTSKEAPDLGVFNISYVQADSGVQGAYYIDTLETGGVSADVFLGVADHAGAGAPPGGIMGISLNLSEASVSQSGVKYDGYIDNLQVQGLIDVRGYSIYFDEQSSSDKNPGTIIFGGFDSSKYIGDLATFPLVLPSPRNQYELDIQGPTIQFTFNGDISSLPSTQDYTVLLDTGTTYTRLPQSQFDVLASALGAELADEEHSLYTLSCDTADADGSLDLTFSGPGGETTISVPWAQLVVFPQQSADNICLLGIIPEPDGAGMYILGETTLRSMYMLFNYDDLTVGLAQASYDDSCNDCVEPLKPK